MVNADGCFFQKSGYYQNFIIITNNKINGTLVYVTEDA